MSDFVVSQGALKLCCFSSVLQHSQTDVSVAFGALCHMVICWVKMLSLEAQSEDSVSEATMCIRLTREDRCLFCFSRLTSTSGNLVLLQKQGSGLFLKKIRDMIKEIPPSEEFYSHFIEFLNVFF